MIPADNPNQSISTKNVARKRVSSGSLYDMAAVDAMGEVDEMPSTEENFKNDVALNGDGKDDEDSAEEAAVKATKTVADVTDNSLPSSEPMEIGESEAANNEEQGNISADSQDDETSNHSREDTEMEITEDSKDSKQVTEEEDEDEENDDEEEEEDDDEEGQDEVDNSRKVQTELENGSCDSQERETDEVSCVSQEVVSEETESVKNDNSRATSALSNNTDEIKEVEVNDPLSGDKETESKSPKQSEDTVITLNDSNENDADIVVVDGKENSSSDANQNRKHKISESDEVIDLDSPVKKKKKAKAPPDLPARRSSRNLNKERKSYVEEDDYELEVEKKKRADSEESDIEEVLPEDPLAVTDHLHNELRTGNKGTNSPSSTIVVKDTKRLVEIASQSNNSNISKKEPTLVIIDTNSILSGRGPIPIAQKSSTSSSSLSTSTFNMLPMALPAQGVYPANMRATITPIPIGASTPKGSATSLLSPVSVSSGAGQSILSSVVLPTVQSNSVHMSSVVHQPTLLSTTAQASPSLAPPPLLPTLTDDMFVVEAPSFIVPYVYEKPPMKDMKEFLKEVVEKEAAEEKRKKDEEEEKKKKEEYEKEKEQQKKNEEEKQKEKDEEAKEKEGSEEMEVDDAKIENKEDKTEGDSKSKETIESDEEEDDENKEDKKNKHNAQKDLDDDKKAEEAKTKEKDQNEKKEASSESSDKSETTKLKTYFDTPLGSFFVDLGFNLVQEFVQNDLLRQQKRKRDREQGQNAKTNKTIASLIKNLEFSKENNEPFRMEMKKCQFCSFRTESSLAMAFHLETPHMKNYIYRCNFCPYEIRSPHDILFHMEAEHGVRGRLERAPAFHQCPNCPFEDNQKGKLSRHLVACARKFRPERNLEPPGDWDPPAKIPRAPRMKQTGLNATAAMYQAMAQRAPNPYQIMQKLQVHQQPGLQRGRGRPSLGTVKTPPNLKNAGGMVYKQMSGGSVFVPTSYQLSGNQVFQVVGGQEIGARLATVGSTAFVPNLSTAPPTSVTIQQQAQQSQSTVKSKPVQQPSISITPLPRGSASSNSTSTMLKPGDSSSKNSFVICEICDGYIKDLEQLRNHMQWIHKVKIHPKMIYNRPPLNCQKCQFRFFTDQGLERHLLGSHGLVTSSMQEAANKSKDAGRCPVCGRVYQWKLLNHVARDHNMTLKPAHLSYKCTVCTATFGMYKQFENHVYSAHSVVAKRVMDKKGTNSNNLGSSGSSSSKNDSALLKPLKINDEITIIPQPAKSIMGKDGGSLSSRIDTAMNKSNLSESSLSLLSRAERLVRQKTASHSRTGD